MVNSENTKSQNQGNQDSFLSNHRVNIYKNKLKKATKKQQPNTTVKKQ